MSGNTVARCIAWSILAALPAAQTATAEDGYDLWLRYRPVAQESREAYRRYAASLVLPPTVSPTVDAAIDELRAGLGKMLSAAPPVTGEAAAGSIVLALPSSSAVLNQVELPLDSIGPDGFLIRSARLDGHAVTIIAARRDIGLLYGSFALLRTVQNRQPLAGLAITSSPAIDRRLLNHWDNLDRTVERGYSGQSIWDWWRLPGVSDPRYRDYARANASIGINGAVLNNVNASSMSLTARYIEKATALADIFRPWGVRVYLSARFTAPIELGGLATADPLDPGVRTWWKQKADEIYKAIPDFGGFLVKANSEGQPGPQDYGRTHADGANMLAAALEPHGGVVMWRAFVYSQDDAEDRARQAYSEFKPLDGKFADNVMLQVKNGPIDFQPREPFHPLFGAMADTPVMMEFQITKEYLGFSTHLVYLGTLFEEVLSADTFVEGPGSTVANVIDGSLRDDEASGRLTGIAGVANTGTDRDWSGSIFDQANWYAFGRLAWAPEQSAKAIAGEWLKMTFTNEPRFIEPALDMMMRSREAVVDYMTPLGLAHLMGTGHHYGPAPWVSELDRPEWNPVYYHRADAEGIGFDRTETGSQAIEQYAPEVAEKFASLETVPEELLLWFHHVPWDYRLASGDTLWQELVAHYDRGVAEVERMQATWTTLEPYVDRARFRKTAEYLAIQRREAKWWRDACLAYFQHVSGLEYPAGVEPPKHSLEYYENLQFPFAPGR